MRERDNVKPNGMYYDWRTDDSLNELQMMHIRGDIDLYEPVEAYKEAWEHVKHQTGHYLSSKAVPGTKVREDLPPIYIQWKDDFRRRHAKNRKR
jgi:hypothetical protein